MHSFSGDFKMECDAGHQRDIFAVNTVKARDWLALTVICLRTGAILIIRRQPLPLPRLERTTALRPKTDPARFESPRGPSDRCSRRDGCRRRDRRPIPPFSALRGVETPPAC